MSPRPTSAHLSGMTDSPSTSTIPAADIRPGMTIAGRGIVTEVTSKVKYRYSRDHRTPDSRTYFFTPAEGSAVPATHCDGKRLVEIETTTLTRHDAIVAAGGCLRTAIRDWHHLPGLPGDRCTSCGVTTSSVAVPTQP